MPNFKYKYIDKDGKKGKGKGSAGSVMELEASLKEDGKWLLDAETYRIDNDTVRKQKVQPRELIDFFVQLFAMTRAGVAILEALGIVSKEMKNMYFKMVVSNVIGDIESGSSFEDAVAKYPDVFDSLCVNSIKAGSSSGRLEQSLNHLINHYEWVENIKGHIKKASLYPIILSVGIIAFTFFMFTFVVPKFVVLLSSFNVPMPLPTKIMFNINSFLSNYSIYLIVFSIAIFSLIVFLKKTNEDFLYKFDKLKLKVPVFGFVNEMIIVSRFLHTISALLRSGILIVEALEIASESMGNKYFEVEMHRVIVDVINGERLSLSISKHDIFKPMVKNMIAVGEESGNIEDVLEYIYEYYDREIPKKVDMAITVLTQIVTVILGAIVALIAFAVFLPITEMTQALKHR